MIRLPAMLRQLQSRTVLIIIAALLLVLNLGRLAINYYDERREELDNKIALLEQYHAAAQQLGTLKNSVAGLEKQRSQLEVYLFTGASEEEIASAMQIMIQEMVVKAGLEPEFLRPVKSGGTAKSKEYGEIAIKVRMAGNLTNFVEFIRNLYRSDRLFKIESFTLKPFKNTELKIFLELKGYYKGA